MEDRRQLGGSGVLWVLFGDLKDGGGVGSKPHSCLGEEPVGLHVERQAAAVALKLDRIVNNAN